jgi:hypothetical protein
MASTFQYTYNIFGLVDIFLFEKQTILIPRGYRDVTFIYQEEKMWIFLHGVGGGVLALRCIWTYYGKCIKKPISNVKKF